MRQIETHVEGRPILAFIYTHDTRETYIVSIPDINFSIEYDRTLPADEQVDLIVIHLFNVMDEASCESVARDITEATSIK
ncbi:YueH family protein [Salinicoccus sesuvii]|uniref:YueH family protein n=1 Tax=Salinicoccus sesuvii TaxID=868281 RepID=A0ABV7N9E6_9STAP